MRRWLLTITVALLTTVNAAFAEDWKGTHANDGLVKEYREDATAPLQELPIPIHIAEEQENCTWRSRMGGLGVFFHGKPNGPLDCD